MVPLSTEKWSWGRGRFFASTGKAINLPNCFILPYKRALAQLSRVGQDSRWGWLNWAGLDSFDLSWILKNLSGLHKWLYYGAYMTHRVILGIAFQGVWWCPKLLQADHYFPLNFGQNSTKVGKKMGHGTLTIGKIVRSGYLGNSCYGDEKMF